MALKASSWVEATLPQVPHPPSSGELSQPGPGLLCHLWLRTLNHHPPLFPPLPHSSSYNALR